MEKSTEKVTVLLVEDEVLIAMLQEQTLSRAGYSVVKARTAEEAIATMNESSRRLPIDLILMDIDLGEGMDGTEAAREILRTHQVPLIFLSSHEEVEIVRRAEGISSYGYVVKQSAGVVLITSIRMALRLWESHRQQMNLARALEESERRFQQVLADVREVAVQGYAADGTTTYWNTASELIYGYTAEEAIGKKLWELIIPTEMVYAVKKNVAHMIETGAPVKPETLTLVDKNGEPVRVRSSHSVTWNTRGEAELFCLDVPVETALDETSVS